jgi:hypothetical protein
MPLGPAFSVRVVVIAAIAFTGLGGCQGQAEGQLCSPSAGNMGSNDCQSGLLCVTATRRCCPQDPSTAKTDVCSLHGGSLDASPTPPDASADTSTQEASIDGPVESSSDVGAGIDASDAATGIDASVATGAEPSEATTANDASDASSE